MEVAWRKMARLDKVKKAGRAANKARVHAAGAAEMPVREAAAKAASHRARVARARDTAILGDL